MSNPLIKRWMGQNKDQGAYALFAGFENEIRKNELLNEAYGQIDIYAQIQLFSLFIDLLDEATSE